MTENWTRGYGCWKLPFTENICEHWKFEITLDFAGIRRGEMGNCRCCRQANAIESSMLIAVHIIGIWQAAYCRINSNVKEAHSSYNMSFPALPPACFVEKEKHFRHNLAPLYLRIPEWGIKFYRWIIRGFKWQFLFLHEIFFILSALKISFSHVLEAREIFRDAKIMNLGVFLWWLGLISAGNRNWFLLRFRWGKGSCSFEIRQP